MRSMIKEAVRYLLTPKSSLAKKYGFLYGSIALQSRFERCKASWLPHLKNCQDLFLNEIKDLPQKNSVVVLGSAHLHEIPLHLLGEHFKEITLVDVIHPLEHHRLAKKHSNLHLVTQDLSGLLENLADLSTLEDLHQQLKNLATSEQFKFDADLIISGNLLSQLGLLPISAMERKLKRLLSTEEKDKICNAFAQNHLKNLAQCNGKKIIYSDRIVTYKNSEGQEIYQGQYPVDFSAFTKIKEWVWQIAPLKEASKEYSIEMTIEAYKA